MTEIKKCNLFYIVAVRASEIATPKTIKTAMEQDKELVELILKGERERFGVLVERYQRAIYRYLMNMGLDHDEAADVLQSAFVKAYNKLHTLRGGERFRVWMYSIAANQAKNYLRRRVRVLPLEEPHMPVHEEDPGLPVEREQLRGLLSRALNRLPEDQRKIVVLRAFEDMPFKEVAKVCNISLSSAKTNYHRALKKMQKWLKPEASRMNSDFQR
jgi:RNA polymerase sigma-70 factor (ECF subfamily)